MAAPFDYFVILADMRTGSNFLEANLEEFPGIKSHGELFNPHFIGSPGNTEALGKTLKQREADPLALLEKLRKAPKGIHGFRLFRDHDQRAIDFCLNDRRCAKIVLTRNPLDSYVSREIARKTNQWRLGDMKHAKTARITFDAKRFEEHLSSQQAFYMRVHRALQTSGQTAFHIDYEDIPEIEVLNGLARFLGADGERKKTTKKIKKQNPQTLEEKVENFAEMKAILSQTDHFSLNRIPSFEPRRGPMIPAYMAAPESPVLFMPIKSGPTDTVRRWLARLDGRALEDVIDGFTQKELRKWKRRSRGHLTFTVVRHPVERLHDAFLRHFLATGPEAYTEIRKVLTSNYKIPLPKAADDDAYDLEKHRNAFIGFAEFVGGNLNGQTSIRVDGAWASQSAVIQGMGQFMFPSHIFREAELQEELDHLARRLGKKTCKLEPSAQSAPFSLADTYDERVEAAVRAAYQRDYMMFGFGPWRG